MSIKRSSALLLDGLVRGIMMYGSNLHLTGEITAPFKVVLIINIHRR
jgi:hypothetical protein